MSRCLGVISEMRLSKGGSSKGGKRSSREKQPWPPPCYCIQLLQSADRGGNLAGDGRGLSPWLPCLCASKCPLFAAETVPLHSAFSRIQLPIASSNHALAVAVTYTPRRLQAMRSQYYKQFIRAAAERRPLKQRTVRNSEVTEHIWSGTKIDPGRPANRHLPKRLL